MDTYIYVVIVLLSMVVVGIFITNVFYQKCRKKQTIHRNTNVAELKIKIPDIPKICTSTFNMASVLDTDILPNT